MATCVREQCLFSVKSTNVPVFLIRKEHNVNQMQEPHFAGVIYYNENTGLCLNIAAIVAVPIVLKELHVKRV